MYIVINGPKGVRVSRANGRKEGQELPRGEIVAWGGFETRGNAEHYAQQLRETQARVAAKQVSELASR